MPMPGAPAVEAEDEFIEVGLEVLAAQPVVNAQGPDLGFIVPCTKRSAFFNARRSQKTADRLADCLIIVDDNDDGYRLGRRQLSA